MEKLLPLWVVLLAVSVQAQGPSFVQAQGPSFYFPDQPHPPSSPQQQGQRSTQEVLGNFFNDNVNLPSITTSQPAYSSPQPQIPQFQPYQPQTFSTEQPPQFNTGFPTQNNYVTNSPPNNRPRQTSFFGNNYDFFRQFHLDAAPHRPSYQIQPFQTASPSFTSSVGNSRPSTTAVTAPPPTASPSFTSTQFFGNTFPSSPARPAPTVTYNFINGQPAQNSLYNGFEDAAKALGVTHGLRVYTTATLKDNPTHSVATIPQNKPQPTVGSIPENDQRIEDDALTLTPSSTLPPTSSLPTLPSSTTTTTTPPPPPTTPAPVIVRNTGRSVATPIVRTKIISTTQSTPRLISSSTVATTFSTPKVVVVSHSRQPVSSRAFPGRDENDFDFAAAPQQPTTNLVTTTPPVKARAQSHPPPPARPTHTFSEERPLYNNANRLNPGQLYSNTNGAYQAYYNGPAAAATPAGLEEIEPQIIDFNIPIHKMIPMLEEHVPFRTQEYDPYRRPNSFDNFGPPSPPFFSSQPQQQQQQSRPFVPSPPQYVARPSPQPQIAVIVTEAAPSPTPATEGPVEVLRVGPKGRLLKKRRKVNKPQQQKASSTTTSEVTTYRPPAAQEQEEDQSDKQKQEPVTTYRSRFRFSTTTSTSPPAPSAAEGGAASSDGADNSQQLIQSRLKSLERQIRFRHRNKNS